MVQLLFLVEKIQRHRVSVPVKLLILNIFLKSIEIR